MNKMLFIYQKKNYILKVLKLNIHLNYMEIMLHICLWRNQDFNLLKIMVKKLSI